MVEERTAQPGLVGVRIFRRDRVRDVGRSNVERRAFEAARIGHVDVDVGREDILQPRLACETGVVRMVGDFRDRDTGGDTRGIGGVAVVARLQPYAVIDAASADG